MSYVHIIYMYTVTCTWATWSHLVTWATIHRSSLQEGLRGHFLPLTPTHFDSFTRSLKMSLKLHVYLHFNWAIFKREDLATPRYNDWLRHLSIRQPLPIPFSGWQPTEKLYNVLLIQWFCFLSLNSLNYTQDAFNFDETKAYKTTPEIRVHVHVYACKDSRLIEIFGCHKCSLYPWHISNGLCTHAWLGSPHGISRGVVVDQFLHRHRGPVWCLPNLYRWPTVLLRLGCPLTDTGFIRGRGGRDGVFWPLLSL